MRSERDLTWVRRCYAWLLRLHSTTHYERFGESMEQTFHDLLREPGRGVVWIFADTFLGIVRERVTLIAHNKNILRIVLATALLLLIPWVAMWFTDDVVWTWFDFVVAGTLLFGAGVTYEFVASRGGNLGYRAAVALGVLTGLALVWVNLAVGVIGSENNPANLLYVGVLAVGGLGAVRARFEARGMARAMFATALAQMLVGVIAEIARWDSPFVLNGCFAALWVGSGLLFRRAGRARLQATPV